MDIKIKRSQVTATPASLQEGELAYSYQSNTLFIGGAGGVGVQAIGGKADYDKVAALPATFVTSVNAKTGAVTLVKADVSDFVESAYVHTSGTETIAGAKTFSNDVVVQGNLTISGTTTTVNTTQVNLADNILTLNSDFTSGTPTENAGIEVLRGSSATSSFYWDEATDKWTAHNGSTGTAVSLEGHTHTAATTTVAGFMSGADKTKLNGIATAATANSTDAVLLARANHTGTQLASTISDFSTATNALIGAASIDALSDVVITSAATNQVLQFNGTNWVNATSVAGVTTFLGLTDTPANYTGAGNRFVKVNAGATALEFVADPGYLTSASTIDGGSF